MSESILSKEQQKQEQEYDFPYHHLLKRGELRGIEYFSYIDIVLSLIKKYRTNENASVLDLGCGDGKTTKEIAHVAKAVTGVDYSSRAIAFAKAFSPHLNFIVEDITKQKNLLTSYDIVVSIEVIEHIPPKDLPEFIKAISTLIREGSILILTTPTVNMKIPKKHYQHFTRKKIQDLCDPYFTKKKVIFTQSKRMSGLFRIMRGLFTNRIYTINISFVNKIITVFYKKMVEKATARTGQRIIYVCEKK